MPLTRFITQQREQLKGFLGDPSQVLLTLRVDAEYEILAGKLIASLEKDEDNADLFLGLDVAFTDGPGLCETLVQTVLEQLERHRAELAEGDLRWLFPLPEQLDEPFPGLTDEVQVVAFLEQVARALVPFVRQLVFALRLESVADREALHRCFSRLVAATGSGRVKYLVVDRRTNGVLDELRVPELRLIAREVARDADLLPLLEKFMAGSSCRVLALRGDAGVGRQVLKCLDGYALKRRMRYLHLDVTITAWYAPAFYKDLALEITAACRTLEERVTRGDIVAPFSEEAQLPVVRLQEDLVLGAFLERLVATFLAPDSYLVILVHVELRAEVSAFQAMLRALAAATLSPRIKWVIVDRHVGVARSDVDRLVGVSTQIFHFTPEEVEAELEDKLKGKPSLVEQIRYTTMLGGFAVAREERDRALALHGRAVQLAQESGNPDEVAVALLQLGNCTYRLGDLVRARQLFEFCTTMGVARQRDSLAAEALTNLGHTCFCLEEFMQAESCYRTAADYQRKLGNLVGRTYALTWLGETYRHLRRQREAVGAFREALAVCDEAGPFLERQTAGSRAEILLRLAEVYRESGDSAKARQCTQEAGKLGATHPLSDVP